MLEKINGRYVEVRTISWEELDRIHEEAETRKRIAALKESVRKIK